MGRTKKQFPLNRAASHALVDRPVGQARVTTEAMVLAWRNGLTPALSFSHIPSPSKKQFPSSFKFNYLWLWRLDLIRLNDMRPSVRVQAHAAAVLRFCSGLQRRGTLDGMDNHRVDESVRAHLRRGECAGAWNRDRRRERPRAVPGCRDASVRDRLPWPLRTLRCGPDTSRGCGGCLRRSPNSSMICAWMGTSRAVVGSSATSSFGCDASAIVIITRCCMPPDISCG